MSARINWQQWHCISEPRGVLRRAAVAALLTLLILPAEAANFYRFRDASGSLVIASSIPNDRVPMGYEVIDGNSGRTIREVAPQLSPEEAAASDELARRLAICERSQRRVQIMYEAPRDIDAAERQALTSLDNRILNANASLAQVRNQLRQFEEQAARLERSGSDVTSRLVDNIQRVKAQITNLDKEIAQRRAEQDETRREYASDREIFKIGECEEFLDSALFDQEKISAK